MTKIKDIEEFLEKRRKKNIKILKKCGSKLAPCLCGPLDFTSHKKWECPYFDIGVYDLDEDGHDRKEVEALGRQV